MSGKKLTDQEREQARKAVSSQQTQRGGMPERELVSRRGDRIEQIPIEWLWPGRYPCGKLTALAGDPGLGKSQVALDAAMRITTGADWPDGEKGSGEAANAIILSAEDDADDTMMPRLDFMGADLSRITVVDASRPVGDNERLSPVNLVGDIEALRKTIDGIDNLKLVVIDPLTEYLGGVNTDKNGEVRGALVRLRMLAAEKRFAVLVVMHLNKSEASAAIQRISGSMAFMALMRKVFFITPSPKEPVYDRLFIPGKSNIGAFGESLTFVIEAENGDPKAVRTKVAWKGSAGDLNINDVLGVINQRASSDGGAKLNDAKNKLRLILKDGPRLSSDVVDQTLALGISSGTYRRAISELGIIAGKAGKKGPKDPWTLRLPGDDDKKKYQK